jgi:hypothetical protein
MRNVKAVWLRLSLPFRQLCLGQGGGLTCGAVRDESQAGRSYGHHSVWVFPTRLSAEPMSCVYIEDYRFNILEIREVFLTTLLSVC